MPSISKIISALEKIPAATWLNPDPERRPVVRGVGQRYVSRAGSQPFFDDGGFTPPTSGRWDDAVDRVRRRLTEGSGDESGVEALAWYVSFHAHAERWGIYIPLSSMVLLDELYFSHLPMPRPARWQLARDILIAHEIVHFAVDYAVAWFELYHFAAIRRVLVDRMQSGFAAKAFPDRQTYLEIEEQLANGNVLREVARGVSPDAEAAIRKFIREQPAGYRDGECAEAAEGFDAALAETIRSYLSVWSSGLIVDPGSPALDLVRLLPLDGEARQACQIWTINDLEDVGLPKDAVRQFMAVQPIDETPRFKKRLEKMHQNHQRAWNRLKEALAVGIPKGCDFKKWPAEDAWSVRVNDNVRAHLQAPDPVAGRSAWLAVKIGAHKEMGHG